MPAPNSKKLDITGKANRKRSRPGESPRPRPKDRQMIQDRIKELREIVPNGAKVMCVLFLTFIYSCKITIKIWIMKLGR